MISSIGLSPAWDIYEVRQKADDYEDYTNWNRRSKVCADYIVKVEELLENNTILIYVAIPVHKKDTIEVRRVLKWLDTHQSTLEKVRSASLFVEHVDS